jgi:hypothetical protein
VLIKLQSLYVREYQLIRLRAGKRRPRATKRFPASRYITDIGAVLPSLPDLVDIDICVVADIVDWDEVNSEGYYSDLEFEPPHLRVDYKLSVLRTSSKATVVLDRTQTFKDR